MIAAFLQAEVDSPRYGSYVKKGLAALGSERSVVDMPDLNDSEQNRLRKRLLWYRGYEAREDLFKGFPPDATWRRVGLEASDFETLQYIAHLNWNELSNGTRRVGVGAQNLLRFASDQRFQHIFAIAQAIRDGKQFGPLIAAQHNGGSLVLIEGHSRATAYASEHFAGVVEAFVGCSPSMNTWVFY